jgi:hypothetical protein
MLLIDFENEPKVSPHKPNNAMPIKKAIGKRKTALESETRGVAWAVGGGGQWQGLTWPCSAVP